MLYGGDAGQAMGRLALTRVIEEWSGPGLPTKAASASAEPRLHDTRGALDGYYEQPYDSRGAAGGRR
jgi:hypothetical protein